MISSIYIKGVENSQNIKQTLTRIFDKSRERESYQATTMKLILITLVLAAYLAKVESAPAPAGTTVTSLVLVSCNSTARKNVTFSKGSNTWSAFKNAACAACSISNCTQQGLYCGTSRKPDNSQITGTGVCKAGFALHNQSQNYQVKYSCDDGNTTVEVTCNGNITLKSCKPQNCTGDVYNGTSKSNTLRVAVADANTTYHVRQSTCPSLLNTSAVLNVNSTLDLLKQNIENIVTDKLDELDLDRITNGTVITTGHGCINLLVSLCGVLFTRDDSGRFSWLTLKPTLDQDQKADVFQEIAASQGKSVSYLVRADLVSMIDAINCERFNTDCNATVIVKTNNRNVTSRRGIGSVSGRSGLIGTSEPVTVETFVTTTIATTTIATTIATTTIAIAATVVTTTLANILTGTTVVEEDTVGIWGLTLDMNMIVILVGACVFVLCCIGVGLCCYCANKKKRTQVPSHCYF
ncbi:hypothetical protein [Cyprinid herpesvirus 2]|uniref:Uncharacterized protein n=2 Tax=Cyprinid herpesvirus 2 TaxID=317878 RepID=A0A0E3X967_CYHV2|nr:hypothetical protein [Cyprinid herpesvirus 2]